VHKSRLTGFLLIAILALSGAVGLAQEPTSSPTVEALEAVGARDLADIGLDLAISGRFEQSQQRLAAALERDGDNDQARAALSLIEDYNTRMERADAQRSQEYQAAVRRVERAMLAQEYVQAHADEKPLDELREDIKKLSEAMGEIKTADTLETAEADQAAKIREDALDALDNAMAQSKAVGQQLEGFEKDHFAEALGKLVANVEKQLAAYRQDWQALKTETVDQRFDGAEALRSRQQDVADAMADMETMTSRKPWRVALAHGRLAKDLVPAGVEIDDEKWYAQLKKLGEVRGGKAVDEADWFDALYAYSSLGELEPANPAYRRLDKVVRRHVRIVGLYGDGSHSEDDGAAGTESPEEGEEEAAATNDIDWRELVRGVDADMVKSAISQMEEFYVTPVDYRKVAAGALTSIRVLAETPQATHSFPALGDKEKKAKFVAAITRQEKLIAQRDRLDHLDLQLALNDVLRAARHVNVPPEVIAMEYGEGMLDELDKFSSMVWPNDVDDFRKQTMGTFFGIGIQISKEEGEPLRVVTPLPGSPAYEAGIQTNDLIVEVDGKSTEPVNLDKLVRMITGPKGTYVKLKIKRAGVVQPIDVSVKRDEIIIQTVKGWQMKGEGQYDFVLDEDSGIGYIRLTQFTDQTAADLRAALNDLRAKGVHSVVLDLRFNPGGLLRSARDVADEFLDGGTVVSTRGRQTHKAELNATGRGDYERGELVVLVNRFSASAAEIVSGALKDYHRAVILGERSFGKGSVQNVIPIRRHDAYLKLTTAYYYLPSGRLLHRKENGESDDNYGVAPDVEVLLTPKQMNRWLDIRRKTDLLQEVEPEALAADLEEQFDADLQLQTAVLLLKLRQIKAGQAPAAATVAR
jgi:carboxyl-terminal processing protease